MMLLWMGGATSIFVQMLVASAFLWRARRTAKPFSDRDLCRELADSLGIRHRVDVLETGAGAMPMTAGVVRCTIFLPSDFDRWSEDRRRMVLLHELAHVRRGDVTTHLLARTALALYWWNPLAWMAWREFLKERERATDDLVLSAGARASDYASHLLEVARRMQSQPAMGWVAVPMARRSQLEGRLLAILDSRINRQAPGRVSGFVAVLVAVGLVAPLAAVHAQESPTPAVVFRTDAVIRAAQEQKNYQVLENAAAAAARVQEFETAQKLLESAVAIRGEVSGKQSTEYAIGLMKMGDLQSKWHLQKSAEDFYLRAAQILGDRPQAAHALTHLGTFAITRKDFPQAIDYFERAQRVDSSQAGMALMWMAVVREREQNIDEAGKLYQSAMSTQDTGSPEAVVIMKVYEQFLRQQGRADEAGQIETRALATQKANAMPAPLTAGVYRIGGAVKAPKLLQKVEPEYTDEARAAKLAGTVIVSVVIGIDGVAHDVQVVRGLGLGLDENSIAAVSQWRFQPGTKDSQPVPVAATIEINWKLM